jgi:hypothetical protein
LQPLPLFFQQPFLLVPVKVIVVTRRYRLRCGKA